jgi:MFS family permease
MLGRPDQDENQPFIDKEEYDKDIETITDHTKSTKDVDKTKSGGDSQEREDNYFMGMKLKSGISKVNVVAIPLIYIIMNALAFYAGSMLPLILSSEDYFAIPEDVIGKVTARVLIWSQVISLIALPFATFVFEIFGRRAPIAMVLLTTIIFVHLYPIVAPNMTYLIAIRCGIAVNNCMILGIPLITDYIKQESRSTALAIQATAIALGQALASMVMLPLTKDLDFN